MAFISGANCCIFCIEWNCLTVSGSRTARTQMVSNTIDQPHCTPRLLWKKVRTD